VTALRRERAVPAGSPRVTVWEVAVAANPGYPWPGLPQRVEELVELARDLDLEVAVDCLDRPTLNEDDARALFLRLTAPRPAPVDPPHRRHIPGPTVEDPSTSKNERIEVL
jgi:hypothetical protein